MTVSEYLPIVYFVVGFVGSLVFTFKCFVDLYDRADMIAIQIGMSLFYSLWLGMFWLPILLLFAIGGFVKMLFYLRQWIRWQGHPDVLEMLG